MNQQERINLFVEMVNAATEQTGVSFSAIPVIRPDERGVLKIEGHLSAELQFAVNPNWQPLVQPTPPPPLSPSTGEAD